MQHFQSILIIIGIFAILAVLIHGYFVNRKEKVSIKADLPDNEALFSANTGEESQDDIIGDVRILASHESESETCDFTFSSQENDVEEIKISTENLDPELNSFDHSFEDLNTEIVPTEESISSEIKAEPLQQDHFIFNVVAKEGEEVRGHELLQFFLTAGFRFGEMSIFHRHLHSNGTGPTLFSIANMMHPGTFDPENMEQFQSEGVCFFLTAPNAEIDIKEAFDMMIIAVEQMAEEFNCSVLNEKREKLTTEQFRNYQERLLRYI